MHHMSLRYLVAAEGVSGFSSTHGVKTRTASSVNFHKTTTVTGRKTRAISKSNATTKIAISTEEAAAPVETSRATKAAAAHQQQHGQGINTWLTFGRECSPARPSAAARQGLKTRAGRTRTAFQPCEILSILRWKTSVATESEQRRPSPLANCTCRQHTTHHHAQVQHKQTIHPFDSFVLSSASQFLFCFCEQRGHAPPSNCRTPSTWSIVPRRRPSVTILAATFSA